MRFVFEYFYVLWWFFLRLIYFLLNFENGCVGFVDFFIKFQKDLKGFYSKRMK